MPEYLAPGVYVEETSFRSKTIEGVSTSTAGFVGPTRFGPTTGEPEILTSYAQFERIYGGLDPLNFEGTLTENFTAHGVRAFFDNGGRRLYVSRIYVAPGQNDPDGRAATEDIDGVSFRARWPGEAGNISVRLFFKRGQNILFDANGPVLRGARDNDTVLVRARAGNAGVDEGIRWLRRFFDEAANAWTFRLVRSPTDQEVADAVANNEVAEPVELPLPAAATARIHVLTATVEAGAMGPNGPPAQTWDNLAFHPEHRESLSQVLSPDRPAPEPPIARSTELYTPIEFVSGDLNGDQIAGALLALAPPPADGQPDTFLGELQGDARRERLVVRRMMTGGSDSTLPAADDYETGLEAFEDLEDISIVAAPGSTARDNAAARNAITGHLISHCERMRYRIAVVDPPRNQSVGEVRAFRAGLDSSHAALYYPWVRIMNPVTQSEDLQPPSGFVAGIYARNDVERGVHKSPANEVVRLAIGFEQPINTGQQEVLNPEGVNCLRFFEGRGNRVWGARTVSSDPEWKYVNLRRYFAFLERSIERGTQWAVFENNGPQLWGNVRSTIEDFLFNEWKSKHLLGDTPEESYFVQCDRSTMTQNDLDNGRLICLVGVAPLRPAEFVIFRIGQWTADRRA